MALPHELVLEVCKHLTKSDLKACRLVSKQWSHHASDYLFSKIYISPRKEDIEVFNLITQHAQLSHCVRHLEYDGTSFSPHYTKSGYIRELVLQASGYSDFFRTAQNSTGSQSTQLIKMCSDSPTKLAAAAVHHAFILGGHREWKDRGVYQRRIVENGEFLRTLTCGLRKLDLLKSVEVFDHWRTWRLCNKRTWYSHDDIILENLPGSYFYGSPFGRAWGLYRLRPRGWALPGGFHKGYEEFQIITTALSLSQRHVQLFHISPPPGSIFDANVTKDLVNHSINAYSSLEVLFLSLSKYAKSTETAFSYGSLPGLHALLRSMGGLKHLNLVLPHQNWDTRDISTMFTYRQVFPTCGIKWIKLNKLSIVGLDISAKDLFHLLTVKMPNLRELSLSDVKLLEGRWEGVIEFLKTSMHLLSFPMNKCWQMRHLDLWYVPIYGQMQHPDGTPFLGRNGDGVESSVFRAEIETYIVKGGRHPCLRPDEDASASRKYLSDLGL